MGPAAWIIGNIFRSEVPGAAATAAQEELIKGKSIEISISLSC